MLYKFNDVVPRLDPKVEKKQKPGVVHVRQMTPEEQERLNKLKPPTNKYGERLKRSPFTMPTFEQSSRGGKKNRRVDGE